MFILGIIILAIIGVGIYFFVYKKDATPVATGLVSTNTGTSQGLQNTTTDQSTTGNQVVTILRNLSVIKLDDSVFRNPAFALLTDISISLPPITNQGRRNPFAPVGTEPVPVVPVGTSAASTPSAGPSF
jgi:hypothetical protein